MQHQTHIEIPRRKLVVALHDKNLEHLTRRFLENYSSKLNLDYSFVRCPQQLVGIVEREETLAVLMDVNLGSPGSDDFSRGQNIYDLISKKPAYGFMAVTGLEEWNHPRHKIPKEMIKIKPYDTYKVLEALANYPHRSLVYRNA